MDQKLSSDSNLLGTLCPRQRISLVFFVALAFVVSRSTTSRADQASELDFFENRIRPVLIEHCYECHSAESKGLKGGLYVDSSAGLLTGGDSGAAIVPGDSETSLLMQALRYESMEMPPQGKLPDEVIDDFAKWIDAGAADPRDGKMAIEKPTVDVEAFRDFWSFVPPVESPLPKVEQTDWPSNEIDYFILSQLEQRGLTPVALANKRQLIRRATFDLTGLPPTPRDIEEFLTDSTPEAFEKVVDRLLRSPAYGERWGRYWLDVARYSEDQAHTFSVTPNTNGWRYRDWVIDAFNSDMPYDLFVKRQIAADLLDDDQANRLRHLPALGYFGLGAQYYKNTDAAKAAADELDDRIDTLTRGFLGLTVSCARCHDHKFDPIPQQDYYSLAGVFQSSRLHNAPLVSQAEVDAYHQQQKEIKELEEAIAKTIAEEGPRVREANVEQIAKYLIASWKVQRAKQQNVEISVEEIAAKSGLDKKAIERWSEFLRKDEANEVAALAPWFQAVGKLTESPLDADVDPLAVPEALLQSATIFERYLLLSLKKRDATLSAAEEKELAQFVKPGKALYSSRLVTKNEPALSIDVDVSAVKQLFLVVTDGGNGMSCDHADWAEPVLISESGQETKLTELAWRETKTSFGSVNIDKNVSGQTLRIGNQSYSFGLGTHATSIIAYDLPDGVKRFRAIAGLDNSGTGQGGCGENATVQFHVYGEQPDDIQFSQPNALDIVFGEKGIFAIEPSELESHLSVEQSSVLAEQRATLSRLRENLRPMYPVAHTIAEANAADMKVFIRGNPAKQGELAPRRFLRVLSEEEPEPFRNGSGRLELAAAIATEENPLTARVMVNRIWQHHFGRGIVGTPDNFGILGEPPTHPQLLDFLTLRFIESGWSIKTLHRQIMLSTTYRLSTDRNEANMSIDADNRYLWRMNRRRLDVEAWRDALLAVSGRLDPQMEGPSTNLAEANNSRRTVYAFISRHELNNMLRLFDFPDANITASTRSETTVPQQQLFVLNSPFMLEQAKAFAKRLHDECGDDRDAMIGRAFLLAYGRPVTAVELELAERFLSSEDAEEEQDLNGLNRWERYAQVLLGSNEFMYLD